VMNLLSVAAVFEIPVWAISFRSKRQTRPGAGFHLRKAPPGRAISGAEGTQDAA
jgi:hypothetical protein